LAAACKTESGRFACRRQAVSPCRAPEEFMVPSAQFTQPSRGLAAGGLLDKKGMDT